MRTHESRVERLSAPTVFCSEGKNLTQNKPPDMVRTLDRGLEILVLLTRKGLGPTAISRTLGLHRTTVHRLLRGLVFKGFVKKIGTDGRYRTNVSYLLELAGGAGVPAKRDENWLTLAKSHLDDLRTLTGLSTSLCMLSGREMIYVMQVLGREGLAVNNPPGTRRPVYCTAVGKAYLGSLPAAELDDLLATLNLRPFTNRTITSPGALKKHLQEAGRRGYQIDDCEFDLRIRCVAAAVLDAFGHAIGSIGVAGVKSDPAFGRIQELGPLIAEKAKDISRALGYDPDRREGRLHSAFL